MASALQKIAMKIGIADADDFKRVIDAIEKNPEKHKVLLKAYAAKEGLKFNVDVLFNVLQKGRVFSDKFAKAQDKLDEDPATKKQKVKEEPPTGITSAGDMGKAAKLLGISNTSGFKKALDLRAKDKNKGDRMLADLSKAEGVKDSIDIIYKKLKKFGFG